MRPKSSETYLQERGIRPHTSDDEEKQRQKNLVLFNNEVRESVTRCVREKLSSADVVPEITGLV